MAFHSSRSTAARPLALKPDSMDLSARARHEDADPHGNGVLPENPTPASAHDQDSADVSAASASLKVDSEASASLDGSRAGMAPSCPLAPITESAIDIPPMPGGEPDTHDRAALDSPTSSTGASKSQFSSLLPDGTADAPSVTSEALSTQGAKGGGSREDSDPTDTILLPASADATNAGEQADSDGALPPGMAGISSDLSGQPATHAASVRATHGDALDRDALDEWGAGTAPHSHDADSGGGTGAFAAELHENDPDRETSSLDRIADALSDPSAWVEASVPDFGAPFGDASSVLGAESPEPAAPRGFEGSADGKRRPYEDPEPTVIALPDLSGGAAADIDDGYLRQLANAPAVSSDRDDSDDSKFDDITAHDAAPRPDAAAAPAVDGAPRADRNAKTAPLPEETVPLLPASDVERADGGSGTASAALDRAKAPAVPAEGPLDEGLLRSIVDEPSVSSDDLGPSSPASDSGAGDEHPVEIDDSLEIPVAETAFDGGPPDKSVARSDVPDTENAAELHDIPFETVPPGPSRALAFAADPDTEAALRDGLLGYEGFSPGYGDPQVWQGGLRAAIGALKEGHSAPLIFVDIDRIAYPAGAIHELAAVCEVGTVVIALGSDNTARPGRELLLAGVSDYLAKPLTAEAVRAAAHRAGPDAATRRSGGCVAGFVGCGGSGTTTVLAAAALQAAERGCYVSVLDLDRSVAAAALTLGVEPAAGLDQLLEAAGRGAPDPEMVEGVCTPRSDRIHVYAHRWNPTLPATPSREALESLLAVLRDRSQLVLVDGLDEPAFRFSSSSELDARVFVAEPTAANIAPLGHTMSLLGADPPLLFVQNHTRAFKRGGGARALRSAGLSIAPDFMIPFEPELPEAADRGWPQSRLPRSLRKPVRALTDRLLEPSRRIGASVATPPPTSS